MRIIITPITCLFCFVASAQNIVLDPQFGNDGISYLENTSEIHKVVIDPNGDIISAGITITGGNFHLTLSKHHADGSLDVNFGTGGVTNTSIANSETPMDIQLQPDGKILVAGEANLVPVGGVYDFNSFVVRYHPNGIIDSGFATNGIFQQNISESQFTSIIVQNDQSILLIGNHQALTTLTKITSAGTIDNTFGTNGITYIGDYANYFFVNWGGIRLNDGNILCYGSDFSSFAGTGVSCAKIDSLGNFITSFGQGGIASFDLDADLNATELATKAQELPDGKIILAGGSTDKLLFKLKSDGTIDSIFATNGVLHHTLPYKDMLVHPNGKILIGGSIELSQFNYGFSISQFNSNGTIDPGFNGTGTFEADLSERSDILFCMTLVNPDHLLTGGSAKMIDLNSNFALAQINIGESLSLEENEPDGISLYPNPFSDKLHISIADESITAIELTDASGRVLRSYPAGNLTLSLEDLTAGMYQVIFTNEGQERISKKLIKQ